MTSISSNKSPSSFISSSKISSVEEDINDDGDMLDEINIRTITYSADNNLGSHEITEYEILNDVNNYFKIGQNTFFIGRVSADNFLNSITCDGIPANFNHDLTFYSKTENEEIYIEFFNNDSDEFLPGEYVSVFSYLNPYFNNQFDDYDQMGDFIDDNFSNQEYYDLYSSTACSDSEYKLISIVEVEFQGNYYEVDLEENFSLSVDLENQTYTISITGYIKQDSENLGSEKVELFYKGALNFEVYDSDNQPDEINDFLDPNYNQSIDDLNLNLLYDSKYHLDGRIKNEESGVGYTLGDDIINFVKNDNFYYWTTTGYSSTNRTIKVFNSDILSYQNFQSDIDLEDRGSNISINNDGIYIFETHDGLISKLNFDFNLINTFNIDNNFGEGFAPENYFSLSTYYERIRVDDIGNVYFLMMITGQDQYGENYRSRYLIKRNISSNETIWSTFLTSGNYDSSFELNFNLNNNQDEIVIYGTSGSTAFIKILNSSSGDVLTDQELYSFSKGSPKLNGFFDDDNSYLFYGSYIVTSRVEKNTYTHSFFYNEQSSQPDFCYKGDKVVGVEKLGENYIFLS
ncbi:MAG: hypothetical protein ISP64_01660 [Flavobacteriaceae bacterium]|nr:hypothetical protein [Flavobacteriaceae bacterium]